MKSRIKYWFVTLKFSNLSPSLQLNTVNRSVVFISIRLDGICTGCTAFFNSTRSIFNDIFLARDSPVFITLAVAFLQTLEIEKRYYKNRKKNTTKIPNKLSTTSFMSKALFWGNISRVHVDSLGL